MIKKSKEFSPGGGRFFQKKQFTGLLSFFLKLPLRGAVLLILLYQCSFSILIGPCCRYFPSCSSYMKEAMSRHGFWAGGWMGLARLTRCHPWAGHGVDFVPDSIPEGARWNRPWRYGIWRIPKNHAPPSEGEGPAQESGSAASKMRN